MDKKQLHELAEDKANEEAIRQFDDWAATEAVRKPRATFVQNVMQGIAQPARKPSSFWHMWTIVLGVMVAIVLWAIEGFALPKMNVNVNLPQVENLPLPDTQSLDMTNVTMIFMSVNALLALFLIDRWYQHRKHAH